LKVEFFDQSNGKKLLEVWTDTITQIPEFNDTVILPVDGVAINTEPIKKRFIVKTREFYLNAGTFEKVQIGLSED